MPFPRFTQISQRVHSSIVSGMSGTGYQTLNRNKTLSGKFPWIRIFSGAENGLILKSANLDDTLKQVDEYKMVGTNSTLVSPGSYGNSKAGGPLGKDFKGKWVYPSIAYQQGKTTTNTNEFNSEEQDWVLRPSPVVTGLELKEGKDHISKVASLVIKCFSLAQLEEMQKYFMEPGFSILIEYGWNDTEALTQLIETTDTRTIVKQAADENLNDSILQNKRINSWGNYDSFFGFIVGANVESENENFIINVNLRGMPGLPTYLQTQHNVNKLEVVKDANGKVTSKSVTVFPTTKLYSISDISQQGAGDVAASGRRYKYMFNSLPPQRQTPEVAKYVTKAETGGLSDAFGWFDLIGFDYNVNNVVHSYKSTSAIEEVGKQLGLVKEFKVGSWTVPKEKLGSTYKYINFGLAIRILQANNGLMSYKIGDKEVKVRIEPSAYIGAFPKIFSTDPTKLIIPGKIPDFFEYFLNENEVPAETILTSEFDAKIGGWSFVQYGDLPAKDPSTGKQDPNWNGFWEKPGYYGDIQWLYINFDIFTKAIKNSDNKSIKDVLLDMLNEMSSAVNSFWNFQLIEKVDDLGNIVIGIIDENWAGYCPIQKKNIQLFRHSGELSVFLESSLQIDIPAETANQIILKRENYISNPNAQGLDIGGIFTDKKDLFFTGIGYEENKKLTDGGSGAKTIAQLKKDLEAKKEYKKQWVSTMKIDNSFISRAARYWTQAYANQTIIEYLDPTTKEVIFTSISNPSNLQEPYLEKGSNTAEGVKWDQLLADIKQLEDAVVETQATTLSNNINKIDIIANPEITFMADDKPKESFENPASGNLKGYFRIYCCTDTQLFDILKNNAFEAYGVGKTSILLPIKYTFKIFGKSGIRRGDVFNVVGIPERYEKNGYFQVINIEQQIEGNLWTTTVTGQYRQDSSK